MLLQRGRNTLARAFCVADVNKEPVSPARFVELLNDELRRDPSYRDGMNFVDVGTGYDFVAPMLKITENCALDKDIFDRVSIKYTILDI